VIPAARLSGLRPSAAAPARQEPATGWPAWRCRPRP